MSDTPRNLPHLYVNGGAEREQYTRPPLVIKKKVLPKRDRAQHAASLKRDLEQAITEGRQLLKARETELPAKDAGFYLEVRLPAGEEEALQSLEDRAKRIELVSSRKADDGNHIIAAVFVPDRQAESLVRKVEAYGEEDTRAGKPKNEALVARVEHARLAGLRTLFTGEPASFPDAGTDLWWEVWLRPGFRAQFEAVVHHFQLPLREHSLVFPEREVVLLRATPEILARVMYESGAIGEVRIARDTPSVFLGMTAREQAEWVRDLVDQLDGPPPDHVAVCLLDSGVTPAHPLLAVAVAPEDLHAYDPAWGPHDTERWRGHGTGMAGLAIYGDLTELIGTNRRVPLTHRLESVKILPNTGQNDPDLYGAITADGIAQAEIQAPTRARVICLAVSSPHGTDVGQPSSWSAALDQLSYGDEDRRRLIVVAAGNIRDGIRPAEYLERNDLEAIESPAQAWNALTVGAYTEKVNVDDPDVAHCGVLAPAGDLSPKSRTAVSWSRSWPNKPDVVLEGGNLLVDGEEAVDHDDVRLLTTHHRAGYGSLLGSFADTSAAAALAARTAARIVRAKPELWPETVRALIVHSAEWTPAMLRRTGPQPKQNEKRTLLRRYGYGVPDLDRALLSASNDLTLVIQEILQPFEESGQSIRTRDMHLHRLPWPRELLQELGDAEVEMRVTLSYFIEPNPGERWTKRHQYASHGLRFAVKRVLENDGQFRARINKVARPEEYERMDPVDADKWYLGDLRHTGSIHSDVWRGLAADLAQRDAIGVFPVGGWWKENKGLDRWDRQAPYALVVSIRAPGQEVDLYTPVKTAVEAALEVEI